MKKIRIHLYHLTFVTAITLLSLAAYFSIVGLSHLFAGTKAVILLGGAIEAGKVVATSFLYKWRKTSPKILKISLFIIIPIVMIVTSVGIYGYLSNAYQSTSTKVNIVESKNNIIENQRMNIKSKIDSIKKNIEINNTRLEKLNSIRTDQESRYTKALEMMNRRLIASMREDIKNTDSQISSLTVLNDESFKRIDELQREDIKLNSEGIDVKKDVSKIDIGTLKYLSKLFKTDMDRVTHGLILILIFIFDPFGIVLIICTNFLLAKKEEKPKEEKPQVKRKYVKKPTEVKINSPEKQSNILKFFND